MVGGIWFVQVGRDQKIDPHINLFILIGLLILISGYLILSEVYPLRLPHDRQLVTGLLAPLFVVFISTLALDKTWLSKVLSWRWLVALGEASFAMYILHAPVIWLYEHVLKNWGNPAYIRDITMLPLIILTGLIAYYYIDPPIRNWMKNILKRVSLPLLVLDLLIIAVSIIISFRFRFDNRQEYLAYRQMGIEIFWFAFFLRSIVSYLLDVLNTASLHWPIFKMARQLLLSNLAGSVIIFLIIFIEYRAGWYINFPRSVFAVDFLIIFLFSFLIRCLLRVFQLYKTVILPAS